MNEDKAKNPQSRDHGRKRKSCDECHKRKMKCVTEGSQSGCNRCLKKGIACTRTPKLRNSTAGKNVDADLRLCSRKRKACNGCIQAKTRCIKEFESDAKCKQCTKRHEPCEFSMTTRLVRMRESEMQLPKPKKASTPSPFPQSLGVPGALTKALPAPAHTQFSLLLNQLNNKNAAELSNPMLPFAPALLPAHYLSANEYVGALLAAAGFQQPTVTGGMLGLAGLGGSTMTSLSDASSPLEPIPVVFSSAQATTPFEAHCQQLEDPSAKGLGEKEIKAEEDETSSNSPLSSFPPAAVHNANAGAKVGSIHSHLLELGEPNISTELRDQEGNLAQQLVEDKTAVAPEPNRDFFLKPPLQLHLQQEETITMTDPLLSLMASQMNCIPCSH
uniref:Zn(2)-C6 fungal-type domain-containing protein n=1 Tax=Heterosigma akashiwo TaxID=2829 RepID=A0A7S4DD17_HETAK